MAQNTSKSIAGSAVSRKQWVKPTVTVHSMADAQAGTTTASSDATTQFS